MDLGPDGLGASSPEYALEFGEEKEEQIEEAPSGNSQSHEVDEVQSRKQKVISLSILFFSKVFQKVILYCYHTAQRRYE